MHPRKVAAARSLKNLNNVSSKEQFVTSKMSRNGKFIEDRIVAV